MTNLYDQCVEEVVRTISNAPFPSDRNKNKAKAAIAALAKTLPEVPSITEYFAGYKLVMHNQDSVFKIYQQIKQWGNNE